jgi:hypothetical protein
MWRSGCRCSRPMPPSSSITSSFLPILPVLLLERASPPHPPRTPPRAHLSCSRDGDEAGRQWNPDPLLLHSSLRARRRPWWSVRRADAKLPYDKELWR